MSTSKIRRLLLQAGVDPALSGYDYLLTAIEICLNDRTLLQCVTSKIYPIIGEKYNVKPKNAERCMRIAVDNMKSTHSSWFQKEVVGLMENKKVLSNSQFIAICVEILKIQEEENAQ